MADVLFLQSIWFEFLGTMQLLACLGEAGHRADVVIGSDRELIRAVRDRRPDLVALSAATGYHTWALALARQIRRLNPAPRIILGGAHATFFPEVIRDHPELDFLCRGEGEQALVELTEVLGDPEAEAGIANLWVRRDGHVTENPVRPLVADLDRLPEPDRRPYYRYPHLARSPVKRLISGRGCPYDCAFCFNHSLKELYRGKGCYVRKRSVDRVLDEIQTIHSLAPVRTLRFEDDLFAVDRGWFDRFTEEYPRRFSTPYICSIRADVLDRDMVKQLKASGCFNVVFGIETGSERLRNEVLDKRLTNEQIFRAGRLLREEGLNFCTTNIMGNPGETFQDAWETVMINVRLKPVFVWVSVFQPYPRTRLGELVVRDGLVDHLEVDEIDPNYHSGSLLRQPGIRRSVNLHKLFYLAIRHPWSLPLVRWLSRLPPNPVFTLVHRITFLGIYARRWNMSFLRAVLEGVRSAGFTRKR